MKTNLLPLNLPKYQHIVDEKLVRGRAVTSPVRLYKMKQQGINQIVDLRNNGGLKKPIERLFCKIFGIKYINHRYKHRDNNLPERSFFEKINADILQNDGKTYIHCEYGKHRCGIAVAIYEKLHTNKSNVEIIANMEKHGFYEMLDDCNPKKSKAEKYKRIFHQFLETYLTPKKS